MKNTGVSIDMKQYHDIENFKISHVYWSKRKFNPHSREDLDEYRYFRTNNRWRKNCPFVLDWPYLTIPNMIEDRLIDAYLDILTEKAK